MKRILLVLACLPAFSVFAAEGDLCPISSGNMVTTFQDANGFCYATLLEVRPVAIKKTGGSKLRGADGV